MTMLPITAEVVDAARAILDECAGVSARDALHAAVVRIWHIDELCSYDRGFDGIPGIHRIEPPAEP
jgi:uncharacterized protein